MTAVSAIARPLWRSLSGSVLASGTGTAVLLARQTTRVSDAAVKSDDLTTPTAEAE